MPVRIVELRLPATTSVEYFSSQRLDLAPYIFLFKALSLRAAGWLGRAALAWQDSDACHHFLQALTRFFLILFLTAVRLRLDDHHAIFRDALIA